jgi:hypothetical protein
MALVIWAGLSVGCVVRWFATTPVTCGAACDVPDRVAYAALAGAPMPAETMASPGAKRSTQGPVLLVTRRRSAMVDAATVMTPGTRAGDCPHALALSLPADATTVTPAAINALTAVSTAVISIGTFVRALMFTTAGRCPWRRTCSMPAIRAAELPWFRQLNTRIPCSRTVFATPTSAPPTVPATWVPCPLQSTPFCPSPTKSATMLARVPNSRCCGRMPVSMM